MEFTNDAALTHRLVVDVRYHVRAGVIQAVGAQEQRRAQVLGLRVLNAPIANAR